MTGTSSCSIWLLFCVVTSPLAAGQTVRPFSVRGEDCCQADPDWSRATTLRCECQRYGTEVHLYEGDIPSSVENIVITQALRITIHASAIYNLLHLKKFTVQAIGSLEIEGDGLALQKEAELHSLYISAIQTVNIQGYAFSKHWEDTTSITIQNVTTLSLVAYSFKHLSASQGPTVVLDNIHTLSSLPGVFAGAVSNLSMRSVYTQSCYHATFGENIHHLELHGVTINEVKEGCFKGSGTLSKLSIQSSYLNSVWARAFSEDIDDLIIDNSWIGPVAVNGFNVRLNRLRITNSFFSDLALDDLKVLAQESILLDNIWVGELRPNALVGLQVQKNVVTDTPGLVIRALRITNANDGSLAFDESVHVCLYDLSIRSPRPQPCPTEKLTRRLVSSGATEPLTPAQYQVYQQLRHRHSCPADDREPQRTGDLGPRCDLHSSTAFGHVQAAGSHQVTLYVAIALLSLVSAALVAVLLVQRCRVHSATGRAGRPGVPARVPPHSPGHRSDLGDIQSRGGAHPGQIPQTDSGWSCDYDSPEAYGYSSVASPPEGGSRGAGNGWGDGPCKGAATVGGSYPSTWSAPEADIYDEVRESGLLSAGPEDAASRDSGWPPTNRDSEPPPPPPVTQERLQLVEDVQENELYAAVDQ